jgi:hypothetical protein
VSHNTPAHTVPRFGYIKCKTDIEQCSDLDDLSIHSI